MQRKALILTFVIGTLMLSTSAVKSEDSLGRCGDCDERFSKWPLKEHTWTLNETDGETSEMPDGAHADYQPGSCSDAAQHAQSCGGIAMSVDEVEAAAVLGNVDLLAQLIATDPDRFTINAERSAVQVLNCAGNLVVAHIPVSRSTSLALAGVEPNRRVAFVLQAFQLI